MRKAPGPEGRAGFVRIDTVHQGDLDGVKGVYHIACVDTVSQWQVEACVQGISEAFLLPVLRLIMAQFPFETRVKNNALQPLHRLEHNPLHCAFLLLQPSSQSHSADSSFRHIPELENTDRYFMKPPKKPPAKASAGSLTHFDGAGQAHMVDVGAKAETTRVARAQGHIRMAPATFALIKGGSAKKGDVLGIARIAAIQGSKRTSELIPLCHPLALTRVAAEFTLDARRHRVTLEVTAETVGRTGVEMEALTAVSVGLLTIYDMCKAADRGMVIEDIRLLEKLGGKSGHWTADEDK